MTPNKNYQNNWSFPRRILLCGPALRAGSQASLDEKQQAIQQVAVAVDATEQPVVADATQYGPMLVVAITLCLNDAEQINPF